MRVELAAELLVSATSAGAFLLALVDERLGPFWVRAQLRDPTFRRHLLPSTMVMESYTEAARNVAAFGRTTPGTGAVQIYSNPTAKSGNGVMEEVHALVP